MTSRSLSLVRPVDLEPPPNRGPLLSIDQVVEMFPPQSGINRAFVRRHIFPRVALSKRTVFWYEADVRLWIDRQRVTAAS